MAFIDAFIAGLAFVASPITLIFTVLSAVQLYQGFRRLGVLRTRWTAWKQEPFEAWKRQVGRDLSFFAAVPIGVAIHELGHAVVIWAFGGRIVAFGYFFFWGFVAPDRSFQPLWREWLISVAGTMGSLLFALVVAILFWRHRVASVRYAAKQTVRFQVYFSLIYYPLFTAILQFGDWSTIYDFDATPRLSAGTAVVHVVLLLAFWYGDRQKAFDEEVAEVVSAETQSKITALRAAGSIPDQIEAIRLQAREGAVVNAEAEAKALFDANPHSGDAEMFYALFKLQTFEDWGEKTLRHVHAALDKGIQIIAYQALAHYALGYENWIAGNAAKAIEEYNTAIALGKKSEHDTQPIFRTKWRFAYHYMRGIAYNSLGNSAEMQSDLTTAISLARLHKFDDVANRYQQDLNAFLARKK